jgi:hypothetical protein
LSSRGLARHGKKRDANEKEIIAAWEAMGAYVEGISGKGSPDTLVHHKGVLYRCEVKGAKRGLTKAQVESFARAHAAGVPTFIIRSKEDAADLLESMPGTLLRARVQWKPEHGALAGAARKERPFRPGTDKARTLDESCKKEFCITSAVPGSKPQRCAAHAAEETFAPAFQGADYGAGKSRVIMSLGDKTVDVTGRTNEEIAEEAARLINEAASS